MTEEEVVQFLSDPKMDQTLMKKAAYVRNQIKEYKKEISTLKEEMLYTFQTNINLDVNDSNNKSIESVINQTDTLLQQQLEDLHSRHIAILKELEKYHRINLIVHTLSVQEQEVLFGIYQNHDKWDALELTLNISRTKISRIRKCALENIIKIYDSDFSNQDLAKLQNGSVYLMQEPKESNEPKEQLSILDFMGESK